MSNPYFVANGTPGTGTFGASAPMRAEFAAIEAGFNLLPPTLTANKAVVINSGGTGMTVTSGSLALAGNFSTTGSFGIVLAASAAVTLTLPAVSGTLATLAGTESLSNKTLVAPALGTPVSGNLANCTGYPASGFSGLLPAANFPALTGDVTTPGMSLITTLATVATGATTGGSTAIPVITFNNKGLVTGITTAAVVAPAGTLTGMTLAATVVTSSLTAVGTIATGVWQGSVIAATYGGTGLSALGTGVATALGINVGSAGAFVTFNGAGGTPSSMVGTNITGTAAGLTAGTATTVVTNANLTGPITSTGNATAVAAQTGTGSTFVMNTSPTLVTPALGVATATSINGNIITAGTGTLTLGAGKTFTASNTLTFAGTDGSTLNIGTGGTLGTSAYVTLGAGVATFLATPSSANLAAAVTNETGTGALVFAGSPALTGTPTFAGASSGTIGLVATAIAGSNTLTLPAQTGTLLVGGTQITDSLTGDVSLTDISLYFDGPSVAQGSTGTWLAEGTVTFLNPGGATIVYAKLWDGATVIASSALNTVAGNAPGSIALSGYITNPAGNIRISCRDTLGTNGLIKFNYTGNSKDSTITATRVA